MMDDKGVASNEAKEKATKAREAAAKRVAERHAAKVALEARSKAEARRQEEAKFNSERKRLRELFGLSELPVEAVQVAVKGGGQQGGAGEDEGRGEVSRGECQ